MPSARFLSTLLRTTCLMGLVTAALACQADGKKDGGAATDPNSAVDGNVVGNGNQTDANGKPVVDANGTSPDSLFTGPVPTPVCTTSGVVDINVTVSSKVGPNGFTTPVYVSNALYSMGIDDRTRGDYVPSIDAKFLAYLKALNPGYLRFPAGHNGQSYRWGTTDDEYTSMTPALIDQFMALVKATNSNAYLAINVETGNSNDATNFITYVNKTKNYGVKWWQIGNEPTLDGLYPEYDTGDRLNPNFAVYNTKYKQYRNLLKSIDPTVKTVGIVSHSGVCVGPNASDRGEGDWLTPFMASVGNQVDAVAWHYYPLYSGDGANSGTDSTNVTYPSVAHLLQEVGQNDQSTWPPAGIAYADVVMPYMRSKMQSVAPGAQVWIDEYAEDSGNNLAGRGYADKMVGALWAADSMARYADQGVGAIHHFIFKAVHDGSNIDFGYTLLDANNNPRPEYYAIWLMSNHYGDQMVKTETSSIETVSSHAAIRSADGSLRVMLVNKSTTAKTVRLKMPDFTPVRAAQYNLVGTAMQSDVVALNGNTLTPELANKGQLAIPSATAQACQDNIVTLQPLSVNVLLFTNKP